MNKRLELSKKINEVPGIAKAYFQPPSNTVMEYPCIRYSYSSDFNRFADDLVYLFKSRYSLMVIDPDPDSEIPNYIRKNFRHCSLDRVYTADNLNHWVFTIYF